MKKAQLKSIVRKIITEWQRTGQSSFEPQGDDASRRWVAKGSEQLLTPQQQAAIAKAGQKGFKLVSTRPEGDKVVAVIASRVGGGTQEVEVFPDGKVQKITQEQTATGAVAGYSTPKAFNKRSLEEAGRTFYTIVILKYDDAWVAIELLKTKGVQAAIDYLKQWDMGGESEHIMSVSKDPPWGTDDKVFKGKGYTVFYNPHHDYIGLVRFGTKLKEDMTTRAELDTDMMKAVNVEAFDSGIPKHDPQAGKPWKEIGQGFYAISNQLAGKLGRGTLPKTGYERIVKAPPGFPSESGWVWLARTKTWGKVVWSIREARKNDPYLANKKMEEMTSTGAVAGYQTPYAFSSRNKLGSKKAIDATKKIGYKVVKSISEES